MFAFDKVEAVTFPFDAITRASPQALSEDHACAGLTELHFHYCESFRDGSR